MANVIPNFHPNTEFYFLSNFYQGDPTLPQRLWGYATTEHFYQAMKTLDKTRRVMIKATDNAGGAKRLGNSSRTVLRPGWDEGLKNEVMKKALEVKFARGTELARKLVETGDAHLIEGNYWHDTYWGVCEGECHRGPHAPVGDNELGVLLIKIRATLVQGGYV